MSFMAKRFSSINLSKKTLLLSASAAALLTLSIAAAVIVSGVSVTDAAANIYLDGALIYSIKLSDVKEPYSFDVEDGNGGKNTISVERGRICVSDADCPDKICVRTGWIADGTVPIVCLPHRLVIELSGAGSSADSAS